MLLSMAAVVTRTRHADRSASRKPRSALGAFLVGVAVGAAMALGAGLEALAAEEAAAAQATEAAQVDAPESAEAEAAAPSKPEADPAAKEPTDGEKADPLQAALEVPSEGEAARSSEAEPEPSPTEPGAARVDDAEQPDEEASGAPAGAAAGDEPGPTIESWWARSLFNLIMLLTLALVLIAPFWLALRWTRDWREPLLGWPIGLVVFCAAVPLVVVGYRAVLGMFPPVFLDQFNVYVEGLTSLWKLWATALLIAVPTWTGQYLARKWRMPEHAGKIGVVTFAVLAGSLITGLGWNDIRYGIDLRGGVILVYEYEEGQHGARRVDERDEAAEGEQEPAADGREPGGVDMEKLVQAISRRVNPGGVKEVTIRPYGNRQIEVIIPEADQEEVSRIKRKISSAGTLEFRILANNRDHQSLIDQAMELEGNELRDSTGDLLAWWVPVARNEEDSFASYHEIARRMRRRGDYEFTEILVVKDNFDVTGEYLREARTGVDQSGRPNVLFTFNQRGGTLFGGLTGANLPEEGQEAFSRKLGIILDGYLQSAPSIRTTIYQRGEITGDFTTKEVEDLVDVLNAGSLPATLSEEPISELVTGPTLGRDTIERGKYAIAISMALVVLFMLFYYRFAGIVACMALLLNVVLILAVMISIQAAFTLPGLAGLVLTVGMAVDANVLIYERIREELNRQATLRMAIRNGFGRATTTIVDANLTTLITATVLYVIGTDQIKGFAVTLWVGILMSMFTAIYCSRVVFDVAERRKWITRLKMMQILGKTQIDFLGMRRVAAVASIAVILVGLVAVWQRGKGLLDIDFTGGVSVEVLFQQPQQVADVRAKLGEQGEGLQDLAVSDVQTLDATERGLRFIINTSGPRDMPSEPEPKPEEVLAMVEAHIENAFKDALVHYSMQVEILSEGDGAAPKPESAEPVGGEAAREPLPDPSLLAMAEAAPDAESSEPPAEKASPDDEAAQGGKPETSAEPPAEAKAEPKPEATVESAPSPEEAPAPGEPEVGDGTRASVTFAYAMTYEKLKEMLDEQIKARQADGLLPTGTIDYVLTNDENDPEIATERWEIKIDLPRDQADGLLATVKGKIESQPFFPSSNTIGGKVAGQTRVLAIMAVLTSLVFIVGYLWIRFQRVMFGLAAVVALVHDVLITLGVIALSAFVAPFLGFLLIGEFKIGLSVLAAFLTIIGYSLNDTIVVFDRIREVRGKAPALTGEMINRSINQTLSRTLLTSLTTLIVVVVLYVGGGQGIHVFSFALMVGVLVGTYSSVFVASPVLHWMAQAPDASQRSRSGGRA
jgi:SecD/SecF fusion protein